MSKHYIQLIVSYRSGGGHGEHEAIEEGLLGMVENPDNPTRFKVEESGYLNENEIKELKKRKREANTA